MRHVLAVSTLLFSAIPIACGDHLVIGELRPDRDGESSAFGESAAPTSSPSAPANVAAPAPDLPRAPMENFLKVTDGIYRGGHPDAAGLDFLKKLGIKTDIDLEIGDLIEAMPSDITDEQRGAAARGITFVSAPMSAFEPAESTRFDDQMNKVLGILQDPTNRPIYVHCKHGQDRTGLVIGLERVLIEHQSPQTAHDEMVQIGFHTILLGLEDYFERKAGWQPAN